MTAMFSEALDAYLDAHATPLEPLLQENHEETYASLSSPQMIAGPVVGRLLRFLVAIAAPRLVVEIGTFTGYSALAMAGGLPPGGRIVTCELSPERAAFAQGYFDRSPWRDRIDVRVGPGARHGAGPRRPLRLRLHRRRQGRLPGYYEAVVPKLSPRGVIAVDNTLSGGDVVDPVDERDRVMAAFNDHVQADERTENVLLSVRDGVTGSYAWRGGGRRGRSRLASSVRRPFREAPDHPRRCPRPRHPDRGRHRQGDARHPPRAAGGRRQLQGRQVVHRDGQGALPGRRRARHAQPRPAGRQDRQRGARRAHGRRLARGDLLAAPSDGDRARRPAGLGQDDGRGQARALAEERARLVGRAGGVRRLPPRRRRPAREGRRAGGRRRLRAGHRPRPGRHRALGPGPRQDRGQGRPHRRHLRAPARRRGADGRARAHPRRGQAALDPARRRRDDRPGRRQRRRAVRRPPSSSTAWS